MPMQLHSSVVIAAPLIPVLLYRQGSLSDLAGLELTLYTRLAWNSQTSIQVLGLKLSASMYR